MNRLSAEREAEIRQHVKWCMAEPDPDNYCVSPPDSAELLNEIDTLGEELSHVEQQALLCRNKNTSLIQTVELAKRRLGPAGFKILEEWKAMKSALEFYADQGTYDDGDNTPLIQYDGYGSKAREVLREIE